MSTERDSVDNQIFIRSRPSLDSNDITGVRTIPSRIFSVVTGLTNSRFANTISNSLSNIKAHYDLSNGMFSAFLSKDMTYSCGIFKDLDGDLLRLEEVGETNGALGLMKFGKSSKGSKKAIKSNGNHGKEEEAETEEEVDELEEAQLRKIRYVLSVNGSALRCSCSGISSRRRISNQATEFWKLGQDGEASPSR